MIKPPDYPGEKLRKAQPQQLTYYDRYGTAGQTWYAVDMGCSDAMAMMGNALANTTFTLVRAIDRTTITVYQAAASESLLGWLKRTVDDVISEMGKTFNARYWSWVVILGAMWLAWWGLIRKRASKVTEGTIWMVAAMVGLIWLVARPGDFTTLGTKVSEATSAAFNAALPQSDTKGTTCIPSPNGQNPLASQDVDATTRNANGLWVALVCKPWLMGEFGTTDPNAKIVKDNADKLLWSQAVDLPETYGTQKVDISKKADAYKDVAKTIKEDYPGTYALFQGKNWTSRLAVAFGALFAALVAGLLVLVIAIALIVVKIAFLLLLVAGPIFLGIGIHPGIGRVIAVRWLELLLSMLLKQAALIGVLSLLLWAYGLILGEGLPWGLQILLISLVTFAAFVYRKPFQHLFSAVGYSAVGAREKGEAQLDKSITTARQATAGAATAVVPGAAGYRLARWGRRDPAEATAAADGSTAGAERRGGLTPTDAAAADGTASALAAKTRAGGSVAAAGSGRARAGAPPLNLPTRNGRTLGDAAARSAGVSGGAGAAAGSSDAGSAGATPGGASGTGAAKPISWVSGRVSGGSRTSGGGATSGGSGSGRSGGGASGRGGSPSGGGASDAGLIGTGRKASGGSGGSSGGSSTGGGSSSGGGKPTSWGGGRGSGGEASGGSAGDGSSGGSTGGGAGGSRGGRGWFGGSGGRGGSRGSSGSVTKGKGGDSAKGGSGDPAAGVPRQRAGAGSGVGAGNGSGAQAPPPLWGGRRSSAEGGPPMPFWLRPVEGAGEQGRDE